MDPVGKLIVRGDTIGWAGDGAGVMMGKYGVPGDNDRGGGSMEYLHQRVVNTYLQRTDVRKYTFLGTEETGQIRVYLGLRRFGRSSTPEAKLLCCSGGRPGWLGVIDTFLVRDYL